MSIFTRLIRDLKPYWKTLLLAIVLTFITAGIQLVPPLFQRRIIDDALISRDIQQIIWLVVALVGIYLLSSVVNGIDQYIRHVLGQKFIYDLRLRLYDHLQRLSLSFFEKRQTGELMSRLTNDVRALEQLVTHSAEFIIVDTLRLTGVIVLLLVMKWELALWTFLPMPFLAIILRWFNTRIRPIYRQIRRDLGAINAELEENLAGIRVVQAYSQEDQELERFERETRNYFSDTVKAIVKWSTVFPGVRFISSAGAALILGIGAWMVTQDQLSLGTLVAFLSYSAMLLEPINRLTEIDNAIQEAIAAGERIYELLDSESEIVNRPSARSLDQVRGEVEFDHVSFSYEAGDRVLHDVSFTVEPGQMIALVGPSGAGKTSIANLVARFYDPLEGSVRLDGIDVRDITLRDLRRHVVTVLQDTFLFSGSVRENLVYGRNEATEEEMLTAAKAAYAHDFITQLPAGYDTQIGERGVRLSGGQKQRLALARAIITDPKVIILDEATSSVDAEAEHWIQRALTQVLQGRTSIVIAHRLSTIRNADKIIALEDGRIVEVGAHDALMKQDGLYSQLYQRQSQV
jgi:ABC-type multidrug transport system fused ATPase/permease subunit